MTPLQIILLLIAAITLVIIWLIFLVLTNKVRLKQRDHRLQKAKDALVDFYLNLKPSVLHYNDVMLLRAYVALSEGLVISEEVKVRAYHDFSKKGIISRLVRHLKHRSPLVRKTAIFYLGHFPIVYSRFALIDALRTEKQANVKLYLVNALKRQIDQMTIHEMIESVVGSKRFYQSRVIEILKTQIHECACYLGSINDRDEIEIKELFIEIADSMHLTDFEVSLFFELKEVEDHYAGNLRQVYSVMPKTRLKRFYLRLLDVLSKSYGYSLTTPFYINHPDAEIARLAFGQLANQATFASVETLLATKEDPALINAKVDSIIRIIESDPAIYLKLTEMVLGNEITLNKNVVGRILVEKIDYLLIKMVDYQDRMIKTVKFIVETGYAPDLIAFLNRNSQPDTTKKVLQAIKPMALNYPEFIKQLNWYLKKDLFAKLDIPPVSFPHPPKPKGKLETRKTRWLLRILFFAIVFFPLVFVMFTPFSIYRLPFVEIVRQYIIVVNTTFIAYFWFLNFTYFILAYLSAVGAKRQIKLWDIKNLDMLNQRGMLSSISIIAPAYNESLSIVESITSLLTLNYPDFEVVVVNDGSKDNTLQVMIEHFNLERKNIHVEQAIGTRPILGIYVNKAIPNLIVVDKLNGGKADALNVGVNVAKNAYICGIDADSLLAPDSLLRLMSSMLDHDDITLAIGGNIFPVNGSVVSHGQIEKLVLPTNTLAQFQAIEYLRAFTLGRLGFADLKALLIVSGAFGLFEKQILKEVGGYLTASAFDKDTVGEDMELVVRITRRAYETNLRFRVNFIFHANCYSEVPEKAKILRKQRNRWQRGLIDIMSYHRKMIFNPKYKQVGMFSMPYFFIFEMVGPLLEIQGYLAIFLGLALGILSLEIVLMLLIVSVLIGMVFSLFALLVNESKTPYLSTKDTFRLLVIAIVENFGWRQIVSIYRGLSFFSALRENHDWGQMNRVGFKASTPPTPEQIQPKP
jgi:peptidoglycan-N-acetylglucosamine deacetylase